MLDSELVNAISWLDPNELKDLRGRIEWLIRRVEEIQAAKAAERDGEQLKGRAAQ